MTVKPRWPADQTFLSEPERQRLAQACRKRFDTDLRELRIDADLDEYLTTFYVPFAAWLVQARREREGTLVVGVCGGQGSGKSTTCRLLAGVLDAGFSTHAVSLSIDDIYRTREERQRMASDVHPLFATRGVPMTHDVTLGMETLQRISELGPGESTRVVAFDKATDTRRPVSQWPSCEGPVDVILFEGWCVGAIAEPSASLIEPINELERCEDAQAVWRGCVNEALNGKYAALFGKLDRLVLLAVDGMERVFEWRRLQERKLAERMEEGGQRSAGLTIMNEAEVNRFIMHYERLTRHILAEMPARADVVVQIDDSHSAAHTVVNRPLVGPVEKSSVEC